MNIKKYFYSLFLLVFIFSCSSIPLKEYEKVTLLRDKAIKYEPVQTYSQKEFDLAEKDYMEAETIVKAENKEEGKKAKELLLTSETNFNIVIEKGYPGYANDLKIETDKSISNNNEIKSSILFNSDIENANLLYNEALANLETNNYDLAISNMSEAFNKYSNIYNLTKKEYEKSDSTLLEVKKKLTELEKLNKELEKIKNKNK